MFNLRDVTKRCLAVLFAWSMATTLSLAIEPREREEDAAPPDRAAAHRNEPTEQRPIIDRALSYDAQARRVAESMSSQRLRTLRATARRLDGLDAALNAVRQSTGGYVLHDTSIAARLEADQFWMTVDTPRASATIRTVFVVQNRQQQPVHGLVVRMNDQSCGFENLGASTYFVIAFQEPVGGLPQNEMAAYPVAQSIPAWMFRSPAGSNFCQTIVASF